MEMPKGMFTYGQFKLESFFVIPGCDDGRSCKIIINGIKMATINYEKVFGKCSDKEDEIFAKKICDDFLSNKIIDVIYNGEYYNLNTLVVNGTKVVVMRKGRNKTTL